MAQPNNNPRKIRIYRADYHKNQFEDRWAFGPYYLGQEKAFCRHAKYQVFNLLVEKLVFVPEELWSRLGDVEEEARAAYPELGDMDSVNFLKMMGVDGCFFLLAAFSILAVGSPGMIHNPLYSHSVFGDGCVREDMKRWLGSMFFVGNQIPFVVLKQLMKLEFFLELKTKNKWKQPTELAKRALFKLLITEQDQNSVDLIHCLQSCMPRTKCVSSVAIPITENCVCDKFEDMPSAKRLRELDIAFRPLAEGLGSSGIYYERGFFNSVLYLPIFKVDRYTEMVMYCLRKYEDVQGARGIEPESSPYIKLLSDLIQTQEDVEILSSQGIIQGRAEGLIAFLSNFDDMVLCDHLCKVVREIKAHPPRLWWRHERLIGFISNISAILLFIFAFLQSDYTVLGYYNQRHS